MQIYINGALKRMRPFIGKKTVAYWKFMEPFQYTLIIVVRYGMDYK